jgi:hypothetical protein
MPEYQIAAGESIVAVNGSPELAVDGYWHSLEDLDAEWGAPTTAA